MAHAHEVRLGVQGLLEGQLEIGIARRELAHPGVDLEPCGAAGLEPGPGLGLAQGRGLPAPVVRAAGDHVEMLAHGVGHGVDARPGADEHAHGFGQAFHDGVGGQGGGEVQARDVGRVGLGQNRGEDLPDGGQQVAVAGLGLGPGRDAPLVHQDGVCVRASHVDSEQHGRTLARTPQVVERRGAKCARFKRPQAGNRMPTTAPVMSEARAPAKRAFMPRPAISGRRSGHKEPSPPIRMPRLPKLAKLHMA